MNLTLAPLLLWSDDVPPTARRALREAQRSPLAERGPLLEAAARSLAHDAGLDCADARELVGLSTCNRE